MSAPGLTQEALTLMLHYEPDSGKFFWLYRADMRAQWNGRHAGRRAGYEWIATGGKAYRSIRIHDWPFPEHRLAWLYMTGRMPSYEIDHRDLDGVNNRWSNLREATKSQNGANTRAKRNNKLGLKGVTLCRGNGKYRATILQDGRQKWLGYHDTAEAAHRAYLAAAIAKSGEFARAS